MKTLSCLMILAMLSGCVKRPDSFSVSPLVEKNKEIYTFTDFLDTIYGGTITFKWNIEDNK